MKSYQQWLLLGGLTLYVGALGVLTADSVFHLGLFPPKLDRILAADIGRLTSSDAKERDAAEQEIVSYHEFSVPPLIKALKGSDAQQKARCADCLHKIAGKYFVSDADYGTDAAAWSKWWEVQQAIDGLRDERPSEREKAKARILSQGQAAIPILIDALRDPNRMVRVLVADTLTSLASAPGKPQLEFGLDREKWLGWWKERQKAEHEGRKAEGEGRKSGK